jgi:hypothetical protein
LAVNVLDHARSVDHARAEEPRVKVVAAVIVVADLLLVLRARVEDDVGDEVGKDELEELRVSVGQGWGWAGETRETELACARRSNQGPPLHAVPSIGDFCHPTPDDRGAVPQ